MSAIETRLARPVCLPEDRRQDASPKASDALLAEDAKEVISQPELIADSLHSDLHLHGEQLISFDFECITKAEPHQICRVRHRRSETA